MNNERASFTQATNVPWTIELKAPTNPLDFKFEGKLAGPDRASTSKLNCATPLTFEITNVCGYCGVMDYDVILT